VKAGTTLTLQLGQPEAANSAVDIEGGGLAGASGILAGSGGSLFQPLHELDSRSFSLPSGVFLAPGPPPYPLGPLLAAAC